MQVGIKCLLGNLTDEQSSTSADSADLRSASVYHLWTFQIQEWELDLEQVIEM